MSAYQCYGRADFNCPEEESKDLFGSIKELVGLVFETLKIFIRRKNKGDNYEK
jgi:hypothetical protein